MGAKLAVTAIVVATAGAVTWLAVAPQSPPRDSPTTAAAEPITPNDQLPDAEHSPSEAASENFPDDEPLPLAWDEYEAIFASVSVDRPETVPYGSVFSATISISNPTAAVIGVSIEPEFSGDWTPSEQGNPGMPAVFTLEPEDSVTWLMEVVLRDTSVGLGSYILPVWAHIAAQDSRGYWWMMADDGDELMALDPNEYFQTETIILHGWDLGTWVTSSAVPLDPSWETLCTLESEISWRSQEWYGCRDDPGSAPPGREGEILPGEALQHCSIESPEMQKLWEEMEQMSAAAEAISDAIFNGSGCGEYEAFECWCHPDDGTICRPSKCGGIPFGTPVEVPFVLPDFGR